MAGQVHLRYPCDQSDLNQTNPMTNTLMCLDICSGGKTVFFIKIKLFHSSSYDRDYFISCDTTFSIVFFGNNYGNKVGCIPTPLIHCRTTIWFYTDCLIPLNKLQSIQFKNFLQNIPDISMLQKKLLAHFF